MKITGTSSYIFIEVGGKAVKVQGEFLVNGFVAYIDTLKNWEPPHEKEELDDTMKRKLIQGALDYTKDSQLKIDFV